MRSGLLQLVCRGRTPGERAAAVDDQLALLLHASAQHCCQVLSVLLLHVRRRRLQHMGSVNGI